MVEETGNTNFWLGKCEMDEDSDAPDPEADADERVHELWSDLRDRSQFIEAVSGALECGALQRARMQLQDLATDLERARMQLEDLHGQMLRGAAQGNKYPRGAVSRHSRHSPTALPHLWR